MKANTVKEQQALQQLNKVLDTERRGLKRLHFRQAVAIKK